MGLKMKQWSSNINWWKVINVTLIMYFAIACYDGDAAGWRIFHALLSGAGVWAFMQMGINSYIRDEELKAKNESTN